MPQAPSVGKENAVGSKAVVAADEISTLVVGEADVDRKSGLHGDDAGNFPPANNRPDEMAIVVTEQGDVVNEIDGTHVSAIISAGTNVVSPASVGIGNPTQVAATAATGGWVYGAG